MKTTKIKFLLILFIFQSLLFGCKDNTSKEAQAVGGGNSAEYVVDIDAYDFAFVMESEIKSGWVTFDFQNQGHRMHFGMLLKFNDPINAEALENYQADRTNENFEKLIGEGGLTLVGGPGFHTQGQKSKTTVYLEPGDYLMSCNTRTVDGTPHYELGMEKFFRVSSEKSGADAPDSDLRLSLKKYFMEAEGELKAGRQTIAVDHTGGDSFDVHLVRLNDTSSINSALQFMDVLTSPSRAIFIGGAEQKEINYKSFVTVNFEPGAYALVSHEYGAMGMVKKFSIPENNASTSFEIEKREPVQVNLELTEEGFQVPSEIEAGQKTFLLKNLSDAEKDHQIRIFKMEKGKTAGDFLEFSKAAQKAYEEGTEFDMLNPTSGYSIGFEDKSSDGNPKLEVNIDPGTYTLLCLHEDDVTGNLTHLFNGEIAEFEVR